MIKNERQYKISKARLNEFNDSILELSKTTGNNSPATKLKRSALVSLADDLKRDIQEYDDLKSGVMPIEQLDTVEELARNLIRARISLNLSQKQLGKLVDLSEQQIQRYESTDYESISMSKIQKIISAMNLEINKRLIKS